MSDTKVFIIIATVIGLWTRTHVVQGKYIYPSAINQWVRQSKVVATWEQAKVNCENEGAILASPINNELVQYMTSLIDVDHHESSYFIGMKLIQNTEVFKSIEGTLLDDLPEAIINRIDKLDPREGDCLGMSRSNIHVVPCWARLPYLCFSNTTTNSPIHGPTTTSRPVMEMQQPTSRWSGWTQYRTSTESSIDASTSETTDWRIDYKYHSATGNLYKVHKRLVSWDVANATCASEGAYLVVLNDSEEAAFVAGILTNPHYKYYSSWTGHPNSRSGEASESTTDHGELFNGGGVIEWEQWSDAPPQKCTVFSAQQKKLYRFSCDSTWHFTCEMSPPLY